MTTIPPSTPAFAIDREQLSPSARENLSVLNRHMEELSGRESQLVEGLSRGETNKNMAIKMELSEKTIEKQMGSMLHKLRVPRVLVPLVALITGKLSLNDFLEGLNFNSQVAFE